MESQTPWNITSQVWSAQVRYIRLAWSLPLSGMFDFSRRKNYKGKWKSSRGKGWLCSHDWWKALRAVLLMHVRFEQGKEREGQMKLSGERIAVLPHGKSNTLEYYNSGVVSLLRGGWCMVGTCSCYMGRKSCESPLRLKQLPGKVMEQNKGSTE